MPFLYLPDAISLAFLLIVLTLLRRTAIAHIQQELCGIRNELFVYCSIKKLPLSHTAYLNLSHRIDSASRLAPEVSRARLFFTGSLASETGKSGNEHPLPNPASELSLHIKSIEDKEIREKLRRFELETSLSFGVFFLLGSISGWIYMSWLLMRLLVRLVSRRPPGSRVDWFFDMAERLIASLGGRALRLALSLQQAQGFVPSTR